MRMVPLTAVAAASLLLSVCGAEAQMRTRVGGLFCDLKPTVGLVLGSRQQARCVFRPGGGGRPEYYNASLTRLGLDLGVSTGGKLLWAVFARSAILPPRSLAGSYVGASGEAALGRGGGANVLVGGSGRSVSLQPLSLEAAAGVNVALGVAGLSLR